jgi:hypothetical protein
MWGLTLQFWQTVVLWANVIALAGAVLTGAALFVSAWVSSNIADVIQQDADKRITEARTRGDEARADAAKANQRASEAAERAASLEKQAAELRLALERETAKRQARTLKKEQFDALQALKGKVSKINVMYESAVEPSLFASQIIDALMYAGIDVKMYPTPPGMAWTGNMIYWTNFVDDPREDPLIGPFIKADLYGGHGEINALLGPIPKDAPLLMIGERYAEMKGGVYIPPAKK